MNNACLLLSLLFPILLVSKVPVADQVPVGNFALPVSQQIGPLIGFGQNIIDSGDTQGFVYIDYFNGTCKKITEVSPSVLYGVNDRFSLFVELPIAAGLTDNNHHSAGLEDMLVQLEGAWWIQPKPDSVNMSTLVGGITFPTGSVTKDPITGFGASSVFLGLTAAHMDTKWYYFASLGGLIPLSHHGTKIGNQVLYQAGIARNISYSTSYIFALMFELDGIYAQKDVFDYVVDCNTGFNTILLTPSLWFSTKELIVQVGIGGPILQQFNGVQNKTNVLVVANIGWKFNQG